MAGAASVPQSVAEADAALQERAVTVAMRELNALHGAWSLRAVLEGTTVNRTWDDWKTKRPELRRVLMIDPSTGHPVDVETMVEAEHRQRTLFDTTVNLRLIVATGDDDDEGASVVHASVSIDADGTEALTQFAMPARHDLSLWKRAADPAANDDAVTLMSVNLWNYNHWEARRGALLAHLRAEAPDIIGFQEVRARRKLRGDDDASGGDDDDGKRMSKAEEARAVPPQRPASAPPRSDADDETLRWQITDLARGLPGYQFAFAPAMGFMEGDDEYVSEGVAVLTRFPIVEQRLLRLAQVKNDPDDFHRRVCLSALLATPLGPLHFMTTHLSLSATARRRALIQIGKHAKAERASFLAAYNAAVPGAAATRLPAVLVGDFNDDYGAREPPALADHGFRDAWLDVHVRKEGETGGEALLRQRKCVRGDADCLSTGWTFNAWAMSKRIDYAFVRGGAAVTAGAARVTGDQAERFSPRSKYAPRGGVTDLRGRMHMSDHLFVWVRLVAAADPADAAGGHDEL